MGSVDVRKILRVPGRLSFNPVDLTAPYPHGGTGLGSTRGIQLRNFGADFPITAEEFGGEPVEFIQRGEAWALACFLRTYDDDAVNLIFPNTIAGAETQHTVITIPGPRRAGSRRSDDAVVLVFTPDDTDVSPMALMHNALPMLDESAEINLNRDDDIGIAAVFMGVRGSNAKILSIGPRHDLQERL